MEDQAVMDYLLQMGAMRPEEQDLAKKQAIVDALRQRSLEGPQMRQVGRIAVAANPLEFLNQGFQGYAAREGDKQTSQTAQSMSARRLAELRRMGSQAFGGGGAEFTGVGFNPY